MRTHGLPQEIEYRRCLAVRRVLEGYSINEVADFLEVHPRTVKRWMEIFRAAGWNETTGFGARDVARLMNGLEPVIVDELKLLVERFSALDRERARELVEGGATPFPDLIGALHAKLLAGELERERSPG